MKKKMPTPIKDGLVGLAIGSAAIVPGISGGTIALIFGVFKKLTSAVGNLFSKNFLKNLVILIPFAIGIVLAIVALIFPFQLAFEHCMFAIVCLFAGFILGSIPGVVDNVKGEKPTISRVILLVIALIIAAGIGILSMFFNFSETINVLFEETPFYLYFILFGIGIISAITLIVPGISGSMLLLVLGFYEPVINLVSFDNFGKNILLLLTFGVGAIVGFVLFSKLMDHLLTKHKYSTFYVVIGFVIGSLISIFVNSDMLAYYQSGFGLLDKILGPILLLVGIGLSIPLIIYSRKRGVEQNA